MPVTRPALVVGVLLLLATATLPPLSAQSPPQTGAISGVVVDALTGVPLSGARVSLARTQGGGSVARMVTDSKGRFVFADLPPAPNYFLDAGGPGFATTRYGWTGPGQTLVTSAILLVPVTAGQWVNNIKIPLWKYGSITGRVVDERGEPAIGVAVRAYTMHRVAGRMTTVLGPLTTTDDRGAYRLASLQPGQYLVSVPSVQSTVLSTTLEVAASRAVGALASEGVGGGRGSFVSAPGINVDGTHRLVVTNYATPPPAGVDGPRAYPMTFYPGVSNPSDAQRVTVGFSEAIAGVDFALRPVPAVTIAGRVEGVTSEMPELLLRLLPRGHEGLGFTAEAATTPLGRDGAFRFLNVPAGDYMLLAQSSVVDLTTGSAHVRVEDAPGFPGRSAAVGSNRGLPGLSYLSRRGVAAGYWGRQPLSVGNQEITNLAVTLHPTSTIRGRLVFETGSKPPDQLHLISASPASDPSLGDARGTVTKTTDGFSFEMPDLLGGTYLIDLEWIGRYGVVSVMWNGRDLTYAGFDASQGRDFDDVVVTLTSRLPKVTGVVSTNDGPVRAAVIAFPQNRERWANFGWNPLAIQSVGSTETGTFTIDSLPEGDYFVVAIDPKLRNEWNNPEFLAGLAAQATKISLKWGDAITADLRFVEVK